MKTNTTEALPYPELKSSHKENMYHEALSPFLSQCDELLSLTDGEGVLVWTRKNKTFLK